MSEEQKLPEEDPVTQAQLKAILEAMSKTFSDSMSTLAANFEDIVSKKINSNTIEISKVLEEHAQAINALNSRGQQPAGPATRKEQLNELLETIKSASDIPWVKEKLGLATDPIGQEFSDLANVVATGAKREVAAAMKHSIKRYLKQGHLYANEVEGLVESTAIKHGI